MDNPEKRATLGTQDEDNQNNGRLTTYLLLLKKKYISIYIIFFKTARARLTEISEGNQTWKIDEILKLFTAYVKSSTSDCSSLPSLFKLYMQ